MEGYSLWIYLAILLVIALVGLYAIFGKGGIDKSKVAVDMLRAATISYHIVAAVEQLYRSGQIAQEERFRVAASRLIEVFPNMTPAQIETLIEGALFILKNGLKQLDSWNVSSAQESEKVIVP